jgi:hypothetical protein
VYASKRANTRVGHWGSSLRAVHLNICVVGLMGVAGADVAHGAVEPDGAKVSTLGGGSCDPRRTRDATYEARVR